MRTRLSNKEIDKEICEAICIYLGDCCGTLFQLGPRLDEHEGAPEFAFCDRSGEQCGVIEVTRRAEKCRREFEYDTIFPKFRHAVEEWFEGQETVKGSYTLYVPWPCYMPMQNTSKWPHFLETLLTKIEELANDSDGRLLYFKFINYEYCLVRESHDGSSISVLKMGRFSKKPAPEDLWEALDHISKKFVDYGPSVVKVGVIELSNWLFGDSIEPLEFTAALKSAYLQIDHLFLAQLASWNSSGNYFPKSWKKVGRLMLLKVW
ncbi:MAG: hypothetical protein HY664_01840 [Chloroflexi bacterium]|nr:hypothetical protein [Chloroflexota bacterium]